MTTKTMWVDWSDADNNVKQVCEALVDVIIENAHQEAPTLKTYCYWMAGEDDAAKLCIAKAGALDDSERGVLTVTHRAFTQDELIIERLQSLVSSRDITKTQFEYLKENLGTANIKQRVIDEYMNGVARIDGGVCHVITYDKENRLLNVAMKVLGEQLVTMYDIGLIVRNGNKTSTFYKGDRFSLAHGLVINIKGLSDYIVPNHDWFKVKAADIEFLFDHAILDLPATYIYKGMHYKITRVKSKLTTFAYFEALAAGDHEVAEILSKAEPDMGKVPVKYYKRWDNDTTQINVYQTRGIAPVSDAYSSYCQMALLSVAYANSRQVHVTCSAPHYPMHLADRSQLVSSSALNPQCTVKIEDITLSNLTEDYYNLNIGGLRNGI